MAEIIITARKGSHTGSQSVNIYTGNDGLEAYAAAEAAADSGEYIWIGKLMNPSHYQPLRVAPAHGAATPKKPAKNNSMKKILALFLMLGLVAAASAQQSVISAYNWVNVPLGFTNVAANTTSNALATTTIFTNSVVSVVYTNNAGGTGLGGFVTNTTTTFSTNTVQPIMNVAFQAKAGLQFSFYASGASTSNAVLVLAQSVDGTNFSTTGNINWTNAANGTTPVVAVTNLSNLGVGYLKPVSVIWLDSTSPNLAFPTLSYAIKKYAP